MDHAPGRLGQRGVLRRFDGKGFLEAGGLGTHAAISIALWVKAGTLGNAWNPLLFCHDDKRGVVHFSLLSDGSPNVAIYRGPGSWTHRKGRTAVNDGKWRHVALVCDARFGGGVPFYVDGKPAGQEPMNLGLRLDLDKFRLGAWNRWENQPANNLHGELDDVRIYSGMLTDKEAARLTAATNP